MISRARLEARLLAASLVLGFGAGMAFPAMAEVDLNHYGIGAVWYGNRGATFNIPNAGGFDITNGDGVTVTLTRDTTMTNVFTTTTTTMTTTPNGAMNTNTNTNTTAPSTTSMGTSMVVKTGQIPVWPVLTPDGNAHITTRNGVPSSAWVAAPFARHQIFAQTQAQAVKAAGGGAGGNNVGKIVAGGLPLSVGLKFTVPGKLIDRVFSSHVPVALNPVVQQVDTLFRIQAPASSRNNTTLGSKPPIPSQTRVMQPNAWSGAGQVSRLAPDFTFTTTMGAPGPVSRQVRQTAGPNAFGGTMSMLISGDGAVWVGPRELVTVAPGLEMLKSPIGRGSITSLATGQAPGKAYSGTNVRIGQQGVIYLNYNIPEPCTPPLAVPPVPAGCGLITGVAAPVAFIPGFATPNGAVGQGVNSSTNPNCPNGGPASDCYKAPLPTSLNIGFPFTSGHVSVFVSGTRAGAPQITTITAAGGDTVTANGVRTVQLVGGSVSLRTTFSGQTRSAQLDTVTITLPEPGSSLMLAGALVLIGGLYGLRRRLF